MANGKIQIKDGAGNNLFPKVRTIDMTDSAGNVKLFDGEKIRPQFIPNAVDDIVPYAAVTSNAGVATVSQQADYHYINVTSKKIYATVHNGTSFVWDGGSALNTTTLYTSNGKSFRWDGTNLVEIVLPKAMASAINTNTNTNEFVPTVAATTAYFQPKGNYAATGHNHNGTYVSKIIAGTNITLSPTTGVGGEITINATDTNTWAVSSVTGYNGISANPTTGVVKISGIDTKGDSSTKGVVITTSVITSNAGGNTSVVPTMNAIYTALAGKADTGHTHNYAAQDHITIVSKGNNNVTVGSSVNGTTTTYYVSTTDTNTWAVSTVSATNGVGMSNAVKTGTPIVSGIDCTGDGTTVGVIITSNGITSTTSNATNGPQSLKETKNIVPTMRAVYNALAGKADTGHTHNYAAANHNHDTVYQPKGTYATSNTSYTSDELRSNHVHDAATGNGTTPGFVVTSNGITSTTTTLGNTSLVPTMNAVYTALAGKAATGHNHDTAYAAKTHTHDFGVTKLIAGNNITLNPTTGVGQVTITATDTNTWAVSSVSGTNGVGVSGNSSTGKVIVSGINTNGNGTTVGVVVTSNGITSTVSNATNGPRSLAETSYIVPTMRAVWNMSSALSSAIETKATSNTSYTAAELSGNHTHNYAAANHTHNYATSNTSYTVAELNANHSHHDAATSADIAIATNTTKYVTPKALGLAPIVKAFKGVYGYATSAALSTALTTGDQAGIIFAKVSANRKLDGFYQCGTGSKLTYKNGELWIEPLGIIYSTMYSTITSGTTTCADCAVLKDVNYVRGATETVQGGVYWTSTVVSKMPGEASVPNNFAVYNALAGKAATGHNHDDAYAAKTHTHNYATSNTSYTATELGTNHTHNYAAATHSHTIANISGLQTALDGKQATIAANTYAPYTHTHNYAAATHSHTIAQISNLQTTLDGKAAATHSHTNYISKNAGMAVNGYFFSGLSTCPAMRSRYEVATWSDSNTNSTGQYPGWLAPITADGMTEVMNTFSLGRGYNISGAGGSSSYSIANFGSFLSGCAVPTFMTFATTISEISASVSNKADVGHTHNYANATHSHTIANISGLETALNGKQATIPANTYAPYTHTHNYAASNTSYTATQLSGNHSHPIANIVGLQTALDSKAATGHTHSNYMLNQAAYAVDGYFFSGLSECSAMRSKYESTLWTHSGGSGTYPGWVAPIMAAGITEVANLFSYCRGYASNASVNANVQSFFSACAVPTFMGFAQAVVELNNSLAGKQNTIAANTYAPYTHTHTGYATSNTSYTAAQLSTNHSHAVATSVAIQTGANNTQYATPQALAKGGFVRQFTDSINKTAAQMSADWANHESHHILFYNVTDAPAKNGFYMGKTGSLCTIEDQSAAWFCREKKNFYWLYKSNGYQYLSAFLPNADIVPTIIENHYSEITNNYITSMTTNFNNFTTINNNTFINIKFVKQYMMINNGIMIVT